MLCPCHAMLCRCHAMLCHCRAVLCHAVPCHAISYHAMQCQCLEGLRLQQQNHLWTSGCKEDLRKSQRALKGTTGRMGLGKPRQCNLPRRKTEATGFCQHREEQGMGKSQE